MLALSLCAKARTTFGMVLPCALWTVMANASSYGKRSLALTLPIPLRELTAKEWNLQRDFMTGRGITIASFERLCCFRIASWACLLKEGLRLVSKVDGISTLTERGGSSRVMVDPGGSDRI